MQAESASFVPPPSGRPAPAADPWVQVTDAQLAQYATLIYQRTGIRLCPQKKALLSNRLRRRLRATGAKDFGAYYRYLRQCPDDDPEWDAFLQEITTHETYLFRDPAQWEWFRQVCLPEWSAAARVGRRPRWLRIWSAACSTGDEPVTVACCVATSLPDVDRWQIQILGTDIGTGALQQARAGVFGPRAMRQVPEEVRRRCFRQTGGQGLWEVQPAIMRMIEYRQHNLLEPLDHPPFDLVLLKNVLIYFDEGSRRRVLQRVRTRICPGGLLLTGAAEGVASWLKDYQRLAPWLFRKPWEDHSSYKQPPASSCQSTRKYT